MLSMMLSIFYYFYKRTRTNQTVLTFYTTFILKQHVENCVGIMIFPTAKWRTGKMRIRCKKYMYTLLYNQLIETTGRCL